VGLLTRLRFGLPAVLIAASAMALIPTRIVAEGYADELSALSRSVDLAPDSARARLALARYWWNQGRPDRVLQVTGEDPAEALVPIRTRALLTVRRWGEARRILRAYEGPEKAALRCELDSAAEEIGAARRCLAALASSPGDHRLAASASRALDRDGRGREAERLLVDALARAPAAPELHSALVALYEANGWMREAVVAWRRWSDASPDDLGARSGLLRALVDKGRGDLLENRHEEAEAAFREILELEPERHEVRYYLADALEALGRGDVARSERERARAAGAEPPPPPAAVPPPDQRRRPRPDQPPRPPLPPGHYPGDGHGH
jgi:thioredoxin-like negative regulator of GroEL